jgi:predicted DNA-binding transcriptional regulator YafY
VASPPARLFGWGSSTSPEKLLHDAIDGRNVVRFDYRGRERIAEPHVLGTKDGRLQILTWQIGGSSSSGPLPNWRRFFVDELSSLRVMNETFAGGRFTGGRHAAFDRQIAFVRA